MKKFLLITLLTLFLGANSALAIGSAGGYPLNPLDPDKSSWFMYNLDLGETYEDILVVKNYSEDEAVIVELYPADATPSTGGGFAVKQKVEEMNEMGSWVTLSQEEAYLEPGESVQIPFTITIPEDASVGETVGGIMIERRSPIDEENINNDPGVRLSMRTGVRVYNIVPGDIIQKMAFLSLDTEFHKQGIGEDYYIISSQVENQGNVSLDTRYDTSFANVLTGKEYQRIDSSFVISRETVFENNQEFHDFPFMGVVRAKVDLYITLKDGTEEFVDSKTALIWVIPVKEIALALVVLALIILIIFLHRKKYDTKNWIKYTVKEGETISSIAEDCKLSWKFLAKANKIKAPYHLSKGTVILLPPECHHKK